MWFKDTIPEAIAVAKSEKKFLVVLLFDNSIESKNFIQNIESKPVQQIINFKSVALKLDKDSKESKQFSQIYPVLKVPCLYIIASNGEAKELIGGNFSQIEIIEKVSQIFGKPVLSEEKLITSDISTLRKDQDLKWLADKQKKINELNLKNAKLQEQKITQPKIDLKHCKVLYKIGDSLNFTRSYDSNVQFRSLYSDVKQQLEERGITDSFKIHSVFPKRSFDPSCNQTLRELDLAPSVVLIIVLDKKSTSSYSKSTNDSKWAYCTTLSRYLQPLNTFSLLNTFIILPMQSAYTILTSFISHLYGSITNTSSSNISSSQTKSSHKDTPLQDATKTFLREKWTNTNTNSINALYSTNLNKNNGNNRNNSSVKQRKSASKKLANKEGNKINTLYTTRTDEDSSSDNNTWNGDSTQQM